MLEELASIEQNSSWTLTGLPVGHRKIVLKWEFKTKRDTVSGINKTKAR
jgi:hypothetical protein